MFSHKICQNYGLGSMYLLFVLFKMLAVSMYLIIRDHLNFKNIKITVFLKRTKGCPNDLAISNLFETSFIGLVEVKSCL